MGNPRNIPAPSVHRDWCSSPGYFYQEQWKPGAPVLGYCRDTTCNATRRLKGVEIPKAVRA